MHHPGPPRFMAVGETVQLAPRDPDPDATYRWHVKSAPVGSQLELPDDEDVVSFSPDAAGRYTLELDAPDGTHGLTVRVFSGELAPVGAGSGASGMSGTSGMSGSARPTGASGGVSGSGSGAGSGGGTGGGRPRVQLRGSVEDDAFVVRADPHPHPDSDTDRDDITVEFLVDDRDGVSSSAVERDGWELRIPLSAIENRVRVHGVALSDSYSVPDTVEFTREQMTDGGTANDASGSPSESPSTGGERVEDSRDSSERRSDGGERPEDFRIPSERDSDGGERMEDSRISSKLRSDGGEAEAMPTRGDAATGIVDRPNDPPEWSKDVTLYEIYVRGFASDKEESQTVFDALTDRLDYLEELGVDCLWLTPVLQNDHAPHGYNIVDFYDIAEDLGTREDYEAFVDAAHDHGMKVLFDLVLNHSARAHPFFQDAYKNPDSEYYDWYEWQENGEPGTYFDWEYIANFDYRNLEVRRYLLDAVDIWAEIADGFRCDMAWAVPNTFWQELHDRVKETDPEFLLLDETIPYIADFHNGMFDMHFDTTLYFTMRQVGGGHMPAEALLDAVDQRAEVGFPPHASFMLYIENHDETRYIVECGDDAAMAAAGALFTLPGVPMLYGGQELGQQGRRDALAWDHAREEIQAHYKRLIEARNETPALGYDGAYRRVDYEADTDRAVAFLRELGDDAYVCVLNFGSEPATVTLDEHEVDSTDIVTGEDTATAEGLEVEHVAVLPVN